MNDRFRQMGIVPIDDRLAEVRQLLIDYAAESERHEAVIISACLRADSKDVDEIIRHPDCGFFRRAIGRYCRDRGITFPGAQLVRVRNGKSCVHGHPCGRGFVQVLAWNEL